MNEDCSFIRPPLRPDPNVVGPEEVYGLKERVGDGCSNSGDSGQSTGCADALDGTIVVAGVVRRGAVMSKGDAHD